MSNDRHIISSKQCTAFIVGAQIGLGVLTFPSELAGIAGHDGWISILVTGIICAILTILIILFMKRYNDLSILEINRLLYGKYAGIILNFILIISVHFSACIQLRLFIEFITISLLSKTPQIILTIFVLLPSIYLIWHGLKVISRYSYILFFLYGSVLMYILLISGQIKISFLMPIGEAGPGSILMGIKASFFAFIGFELIPLIYTNVKDKKNMLKHFITASTFTTFFYLIICVTITGLFGENMLKHLTIPIFTMYRIQYSKVIERLDLFFIMLWLPAMISSSRAYLFSAYSIEAKLLKTGNNKFFYFIFLVITILISRIPRNLNDVYNYINIISLIAASAITFYTFSFLLSFIKKKGIKKNE